MLERRAGTDQALHSMLHIVVVSRPGRPVRLCTWARARPRRGSWRCRARCCRRGFPAASGWRHGPRDAARPGHRRRWGRSPSRCCWPWRCRGRSSRLRRRRRDRGRHWLGCGCRLAGRRLACRSFSRGWVARCTLGCLARRLPRRRLARRLLGARLSCRLTSACLTGTRLPGRCAATGALSRGLLSTRCALLPTRSRSHGFCSDSAYCRPRPLKRTRTCTNHASTGPGLPSCIMSQLFFSL